MCVAEVVDHSPLKYRRGGQRTRKRGTADPASMGCGECVEPRVGTGYSFPSPAVTVHEGGAVQDSDHPQMVSDSGPGLDRFWPKVGTDGLDLAQKWPEVACYLGSAIKIRYMDQELGPRKFCQFKRDQEITMSFIVVTSWSFYKGGGGVFVQVVLYKTEKMRTEMHWQTLRW